jgi:2-polyprenyl-3-methyl-5-hydroxy-6-metoxy-1,4-benzoquinol methylase
MQFNTSYIGLRNDLVSEINSVNNKVLDVGCATGVNGKYLLDKGLARSVYGIELMPEMAEEAKKFYAEVIVGSLDDIDLLNGLGNNYFDHIICGDILEHLDDPWLVLKKLAGYLNENGKIIISLPNVQHIDVFYHIYFKNTWPVNERGIFDKTHRRFFTLKDIKKMVDAPGLKIVKIKRNFRFRDRIGSRFPVYGILLRTFFKRLYTFQYIVVCSHK